MNESNETVVPTTDAPVAPETETPVAPEAAPETPSTELGAALGQGQSGTATPEAPQA